MSANTKICGVYCLTFQSGHYYYGQSADIAHRFSVHLNKLRRGTHPNKWMMAVFQKYGKPTLSVVCTASVDYLDQAEQDLLDKHHGEPLCLNLAAHADAPARGYIYSEAQRDVKREQGRQSWVEGKNALKNFIGVNTANLMRADVREKIRQYKATPESRKRDAEIRTALHKDSAFKEKHLAGVKKHFANAEQQERRLESLKRRHADPEFQAKRADAVRAVCARKVVCDETGQTWSSAAEWQKWVKETFGVVASTSHLRKQSRYKGKVFRYE